MPRWKALPEELDPQVREFASQLRRLVDRSGLSLAAVADRTGYSKTSWERYLNGRLLAPKGAIVALAEVTGTNPLHLTTMWELAERAWSRSEMRHDMTMEAIRISQARAALGELRTTEPDAKARTSGARGRPASVPAQPAQPARPTPSTHPTPSARSAYPAGAPGAPGSAGGGRGAVAAPPGPGVPGAAQPQGPLLDGPPRTQRRRRKLPLILVGVVGALVVIAAALFLTGFGRGGNDPEAKPSTPPASSKPDLPNGVRCAGADCTGKDPEKMRCSGELATTPTSVTVGTTLVEVRYSKSCGAAWARITQAAPGDTVRITGGGAAGQDGEVDGDGDAYTPMVAVPGAGEAKVCATLLSGQEGCTN